MAMDYERLRPQTIPFWMGCIFLVGTLLSAVPEAPLPIPLILGSSSVICFLAAGIPILYRRHHRGRLAYYKAVGDRITAEVEEVRMLSHLMLNRRHPFRIVARGLAGGEVREFKSPMIMFNPAGLIPGGKVDVYLLNRSGRKYCVDLSALPEQGRAWKDESEPAEVLVRTGEKAVAAILGTLQDTTGGESDLICYLVNAQAIIEGKVYVFSSQELRHDPSEYLAGVTVDVYWRKVSEGLVYHMDLSFLPEAVLRL